MISNLQGFSFDTLISSVQAEISRRKNPHNRLHLRTIPHRKPNWLTNSVTRTELHLEDDTISTMTGIVLDIARNLDTSNESVQEATGHGATKLKHTRNSQGISLKHIPTKPWWAASQQPSRKQPKA